MCSRSFVLASDVSLWLSLSCSLCLRLALYLLLVTTIPHQHPMWYLISELLSIFTRRELHLSSQCIVPNLVHLKGSLATEVHQRDQGYDGEFCFGCLQLRCAVLRRGKLPKLHGWCSVACPYYTQHQRGKWQKQVSGLKSTAITAELLLIRKKVRLVITRRLSMVRAVCLLCVHLTASASVSSGCRTRAGEKTTDLPFLTILDKDATGKIFGTSCLHCH